MPDTEAPAFSSAFADAFKARYGVYPIAGGSDEVEQDTPDSDPTASTEETPEKESDESTETVDEYRKRYEDLRPEFDRKSQTLSQYEQFIESLRDPETQAEALAALGYEVEGDEDEDDDEIDPYESRFEKIERFLQEEAEAKAEAEFEELFENYVEQEFDKLDPKGEFDDEWKELVVASAPVDDDGIPDIEASHKRLLARLDADFEKRLKAKRSPQAPSGASPSHQPNMDNQEERREWMAQKLQESQQLA